MPYKDVLKRKEAAKLSMEKKRKGLTAGINIDKIAEGVNTSEGLTSIGVNNLKEHPVMKYLIEQDKRKKMESIVTSLKKFKLLHMVYLGASDTGMPLDIVGELLEVTGAVK